MKPVSPTPAEILNRDHVIATILEFIEAGTTIKLPDFDISRQTASEFALQHVGIEPNPFGGTLGELRYQFEAEEDLLHLFIVRLDGELLEVSDARQAASFVLGEVPPALIWMKAGHYSHHFYLGHEALQWIQKPLAEPR